ncbi:hypothetical protein PVAND_004084 [Polypedilum vanderplanki]|uniref:Ubiquitin-like domain-containing protein n=1 Tax=Polypedilum vanderplanki TaxID=319348 RepID=A0A9J6BX31_POLVA|nr:hypothetical protein PVAND_004084 [Polypedilum vanderplanki]
MDCEEIDFDNEMMIDEQTDNEIVDEITNLEANVNTDSELKDDSCENKVLTDVNNIITKDDSTVVADDKTSQMFKNETGWESMKIEENLKCPELNDSGYASDENMKLDIEINEKESIPLCMNKKETVYEALMKASSIRQIEYEEYDLFYNGKALSLSVALGDVGLTQNSRLRLVQRPYPVFVRIGGRSETYEVRSSDTVGQLKEKISDNKAIPAFSQRLLYESRELDNSWTIEYSKIRKNAILDLAQRLYGGGHSS